LVWHTRGVRIAKFATGLEKFSNFLKELSFKKGQHEGIKKKYPPGGRGPDMLKNGTKDGPNEGFRSEG